MTVNITKAVFKAKFVIYRLKIRINGIILACGYVNFSDDFLHNVSGDKTL